MIISLIIIIILMHHIRILPKGCARIAAQQSSTCNFSCILQSSRLKVKKPSVNTLYVPTPSGIRCYKTM